MEKKLGEDCEKIQIQNVLPKPGLRGAAKYAGVWYRCVLGHYFSVQPVNYFSVFSSKYLVKDTYIVFKNLRNTLISDKVFQKGPSKI